MKKLIRKIKRCVKKPGKYIHAGLLVLSGFLIVLVISLSALFYYFKERILPNVYVANTYIGGLKRNEALNKLKDISSPEKIILIKDEGTDKEKTQYVILLKEIDLSYETQTLVDKAYILGKNRKILPSLKEFYTTILYGKNFDYLYSYSPKKLNDYLSTIASQIFDEPIYPSYKFTGSGIVVDKGKDGTDLDKEKTITEINRQLSVKKISDIPLITKFISVSMSQDNASIALDRANKMYGKKIDYVFFEFRTSTEKEALLKLLNPAGGYYEDKIKEASLDIKGKVDRPSQNPVFNFVDGKVTEFKPAKDGYSVDANALSENIISSLASLEPTTDSANELKTATITIPLKVTPPDYSTSDVNSLGIKELIGKGESYYRGSIASRVHNVALASSKFNGILVKPHETLSFNQILGDVSKFTGYQQAYIIQDGKTVLGDGGGVCQVSTTLFRASLNAGLEIAERKAHSYRVSYYEQGTPPGIDATVYYPTSDLKIVNNTDNHILIQTIIDKKSYYLSFEIYGTKDGRIAEVSTPKVSGVTPPPEDLYTDDPTLPLGQVKQIDWKAWGAKVSFNYKVTKNGEVISEKTFISNYRPWQAKFLRGTMQ